EILRFVIEQPLAAILDHQLRKRPGIAAQLKPSLFEMVGVKVAITAGPHEHPWLEPAFTREHVRQQRIRSDVERDAEEDVRAALVKLQVESAGGDLGLKQAMTRGERHPGDLTRVPGGD